MKIQKHILIVRSTTLGLSSMSDKSCQSIYSLLRRSFASVSILIINTQEDLQSIVAKQPDLVFMGVKYVPSLVPGEKIWVSEFLDTHGILHTGSGQRAMEYELYKPLAKQQVKLAGIPTAASLVIMNGQAFNHEAITLRFPLFVKPASLGGGAGINTASLVHSIDELRTQATFISQNFNADILIEEYLPGREFSVALLRDVHSNNLEAMPIELVAPSSSKDEPILSQAVKASNQEIVLPVTDLELRCRIVTVATDAFNALGGRDYGRIDIRLDESGVPNFLEANLIPSLISGYGSFPKACVLNIGMEYEKMIIAIVNLALDREVEANTQEYRHLSDILSPIPISI